MSDVAFFHNDAVGLLRIGLSRNWRLRTTRRFVRRWPLEAGPLRAKNVRIIRSLVAAIRALENEATPRCCPDMGRSDCCSMELLTEDATAPEEPECPTCGGWGDPLDCPRCVMERETRR